MTTTFEEELNRTGRLVYTVTGTSMWPLIRPGKDLLIIEKQDSSTLKKFDTVLFRQRTPQNTDVYVLHRILRCNSDGSFWIVGDNCYSGDTVLPNQIIGKLTALVKDGRTVSVTDRRYLCYVNLWCGCYPVRFLLLWLRHFRRRLLLRLKHVCRRCLRKIRSLLKG